MRRAAKCSLVIVAIAALTAGKAAAQTQDADTRHAIEALLAGGYTGVLGRGSAVVSSVIRTETATFPVASSAGGFSWVFDPNLGVSKRNSESFGPMFAERPLTNGQGRLNLSVAFQQTNFKSIAGQPLDNLVETYAGQGGPTDRPFDIVTDSVKLRTQKTIFTATYGIHERIDIGAVVPFGQTTVSGNASEVVLGSSGKLVPTYSFDHVASSTGIGDILLRAKIGLPSTPEFNLAADIGLRLPTGNPDKLLGVGRAQTRVLLVGSVPASVSPHFNVGYTFGGKGINPAFLTQASFDSSLLEPSSEVNYTGGVDVVASPSLTIAADLIGRALLHSVAFNYGRGPYAPSNPQNTATITGFRPTAGTVNLLLGAFGVKAKIANMWLITGSILFPLNDAGVKPGITPVIGFERAF